MTADRNITPRPPAVRSSHKLLHLFCASSCSHHSLLNFNAQYTYRIYISSISWYRCHAVDRNYGHLLYLSPSAAHARQRGKRSFARDNDVTPEITAVVLILAVRTHLSALRESQSWLPVKDTITPAPCSIFIICISIR